MPSKPQPDAASMLHRREALFQFGTGIGAVALAAIENAAIGLDASPAAELLELPRPHHLPKARSCIFLMMEGGPSHIDTFDPKPKLQQVHLTEFTRNDRMQSAMSGGKRYYVASPFRFHKVGINGAEMAINWEQLASVADEICFFRGCQVDSVNHPTAMFQMNTGNRFGGDPALGAWVTYGLGSINQDMPGFVVMPEVSYPQGGTANWSNGFLPPTYQGTPLRSTGSPILDLEPPSWVSREHQRKNLDLLKRLNEQHAKTRSSQSQLTARTANYELAFRMQMEVPGILDIRGETQTTLAQYGIDQEPTNSFGRKCLLARRLVERGVRFVQIYAGTWDSHDYIERAHGNLVRTVDRPIAALLMDLKQRGLLEETLVVWCGEFGRSPDNGVRQGTAFGRDHNPKGMAVWLAGGGVAPGIVGATDELGGEAVECVHHVRDLHVTLLHLLGLDDSRLTYYHSGRWKQLSQFGGQIISEIVG